MFCFRFFVVLFLCLSAGFGFAQVSLPEAASTSPPVVLLYELDQMDIDHEWVEVRYYAQPNGDVIWSEPGEKIWHIQERAFILLGASGLPLPRDIVLRSTIFVELETPDNLFGPLELHPRQQRIEVAADSQLLAKKLFAGLPEIDATYLAQVANYLAGNILDLDVQGTTYSVSSFGQVVDADGNWVGGNLSPVEEGGSLYVGHDSGMNDDGVVVPPKRNTGVGVRAMHLNEEGRNDTAVGYEALASNVSGDYNTALGYQALIDNVEGDSNTAVGQWALRRNTGHWNTAVGRRALTNSLDATGNVALGYQSLLGNTTGNSNVAVGTYALENNVSGHRNVAVGRESGPDLPGLINTVALGHQAVTTASWSLALSQVGRFTFVVNLLYSVIH